MSKLDTWAARAAGSAIAFFVLGLTAAIAGQFRLAALFFALCSAWTPFWIYYWWNSMWSTFRAGGGRG